LLFDIGMPAQGKYWSITLKHDTTKLESYLFRTQLLDGVCYIRGQLELGTTGYLHWQMCACFTKKVRPSTVKNAFGTDAHVELSRSSAIVDYVWKEDTRVAGTQFEHGELPFNRNNKKDWDKIWNSAKNGNIEEIPASVRVSSYAQIKRIEKDYLKPTAMERQITVYWGKSGVGKSRRAWDEAGSQAYPKDPCTKFWDGYGSQEHVVIDEFRGQIGIAHVLRWFDRYPVTVETKGSAAVFRANRIWVTSNIDPRNWYPDLDEETKAALMRRLNVVHMLAVEDGHFV